MVEGPAPSARYAACHLPLASQRRGKNGVRPIDPVPTPGGTAWRGRRSCPAAASNARFYSHRDGFAARRGTARRARRNGCQSSPCSAAVGAALTISSFDPATIQSPGRTLAPDRAKMGQSLLLAGLSVSSASIDARGCKAEISWCAESANSPGACALSLRGGRLPRFIALAAPWWTSFIFRYLRREADGPKRNWVRFGRKCWRYKPNG